MSLVHTPMVPPRPNHNGEQVYASMWLAMMNERWDEDCFLDEESTPLEVVLSQLGRKIEQRHATVAATVICWLGCNMGVALMRRARSEIDAGRWDPDRAYLLAWTLENSRRLCVNHGIRLIEFMLTPPEDRRKERHLADSGIAKLPELSATDLEVADHVMLWLPSERGQRFIRQCEREIERLNDEERRRQAAEWHRLYGPKEKANG